MELHGRVPAAAFVCRECRHIVTARNWMAWHGQHAVQRRVYIVAATSSSFAWLAVASVAKVKRRRLTVACCYSSQSVIENGVGFVYFYGDGY